jgi:hypothetical protein
MKAIQDFYNSLKPVHKAIFWALILTVVYLLISKVYKLMNPDNRTAGLYGQLTGASSSANTALNSTGGATYQAPNSDQQIRNLIDLIFEKLAGANLYVYPEVVNRLANFTVADLKKAAAYWKSKYATGTGKNLYQFINAEWHDGMYAPALGALKKTGYYGS